MHTLRVSAAARLPKDVVSLHLELHPLITARAQRTATLLRSADALRLGYSEKLEVLVRVRVRVRVRVLGFLTLSL